VRTKPCLELITAKIVGSIFSHGKINYNNIIQENYDLDTNNRIDKILGKVMDFF
jgi:hypothetical protein